MPAAPGRWSIAEEGDEAVKAYAAAKGCDVDQPRNLAKSVIVE